MQHLLFFTAESAETAEMNRQRTIEKNQGASSSVAPKFWGICHSGLDPESRAPDENRDPGCKLDSSPLIKQTPHASPLLNG